MTNLGNAAPWYALWAFAAGILIPVMAVSNGTLAKVTGNPLLAVTVLFAVGLVCSVAALLVTGASGTSALLRTPPWLFSGGVIVCFYIFSVTVLAPRFGVGNTILFVVAAQILTSTTIDHFGLLGASPRPVSVLRLIGVLVLLVGLGITQFADRKPPI